MCKFSPYQKQFTSTEKTKDFQYEIRIERTFVDGSIKMYIEHVNVGIFDETGEYDNVRCKDCRINVFYRGKEIKDLEYHR